jgi:hypothetical protein
MEFLFVIVKHLPASIYIGRWVEPENVDRIWLRQCEQSELMRFIIPLVHVPISREIEL